MSSTQVQYILSLKDLLTGGIQKADGAVNKLEGSIGSLQSSLGPLGAAIGLAFSVAGVVSFTKSVIEAGTTVENATTGLTTLLKDANAAREVISNTMEDATKTPFAFEGLLMANKALISANVSAKEARGTVLDLANAIAATGGGDNELGRMVVNLQAIKNTGKATAVDIKQFAFAGINIYEVLAKATGKTADQVKDLDVSYDLLAMALKKAHEAGGIYANGLENMAGNTSVQISNLGDALFQLKVQMFNDLKPLITGVVSTLSDFIGKVRTAWEWVMQHADSFRAIAQFLQPLFEAVGKFFRIVWAGAVDLFSYLSQYKETFFEVLGVIRDATIWLIDHLGPAISFIIDAIKVIIDVLHTVYVFLDKIKVIDAIRVMFIVIYETIKAIGNAIGWYYEKYIEPAINALINTYNLVKSLLGISSGGMEITNTTKSVLELPKDTLAVPRKLTAAGGNASSTASGAESIKADKTSNVSGQKSTTINIRIESLIKDFSIKTTNITEGASKMKEMVAQALLSAVNDSQIIAPQ